MEDLKTSQDFKNFVWKSSIFSQDQQTASAAYPPPPLSAPLNRHFASARFGEASPEFMLWLFALPNQTADRKSPLELKLSLTEASEQLAMKPLRTEAARSTLTPTL